LLNLADDDDSYEYDQEEYYDEEKREDRLNDLIDRRTRH